ncbi:MAG: translation initiation factor IF-6 [archaeon]|jgi:translation initiation factor 6
MNIIRTRIIGSHYVGLFGICNDSLCFLPPSVEEKALKSIEETLEVKAVKVGIYGSSLLAAFAKMNNKYAFVPSYASDKEIETIEKEIKVKIIPTEQALGNMIEVNDVGAIVSKDLQKRSVDEIRKTGLTLTQMNIGRTDVVGSCLLSTSQGFLVNPNISKEEAEILEKTFGVKGGSSTANTGDTFVRNSVLANAKGIVMGENTTPYEINRIEEALDGTLNK